MPQYRHDDELDVDREINAPPREIFIGLGWDEDSTTNRKHYRRYYQKELEKTKEVLPNESPFNQYDLKRGASRGAKKSLFGGGKTDASGCVDTTAVVGRFKAVIQCEVKSDKEKYAQRKMKCIGQMLGLLTELAKYKEIEDFDLDLELLDSIEGRN